MRAPLAVALLAVPGLLAPAGAGAQASAPGLSAPQRVRSVVDLQRFRSESVIEIADAAGRRGRATWIDLNPRTHTWFLLRLEWEGSEGMETHHLENADPVTQRLRLDPARGGRLVVRAGGVETACDLWTARPVAALAAAKASGAPYAPLCGERVYLRDAVAGRRTAREWAADLLRDRVWGGEKLTTLVRDIVYKDAWLSTPPLIRDGHGEGALAGAPELPRLAPAFADREIEPRELGLAVRREADGRLGVGHWYPVIDQPGIFLSAVTPEAISPEVRTASGPPLAALDRVESGAIVYLVAFDLGEFDVGFALGTEHPRVEWSNHMPPEMRDASLPGPDGIGNLDPLVRTGMLSPAVQGRVAATFTGGFKRTHGAMRWGALSQVNRASHYGFVENGVIASELQPGLSTAIVFDDGRVSLETWTREGDRDLERIRFARQNGVPLVTRDPATGRSEPGALVTLWGAGNWSGSVDRKLRTLRAGLCLLESSDRRHLVYGWFSSATPSAMATVFLGYGCRHAMLLDMNALEHTYLALYLRQESKLLIRHLDQGMNVLDKQTDGQYLPRFVAFPDNRDFFYLLRRTRP